MNENLRDKIDHLVTKQITNLSSRLFGLTNTSQVKKVLTQFDSIKKNGTDLKLYEELNQLLTNSIFAKWEGMITAWSHQTLLFKKTANAFLKIQAPRKPYVYETHRYSYENAHEYFQADLADMNSFNLNFSPHRPEFCSKSLFKSDQK